MTEDEIAAFIAETRSYVARERKELVAAVRNAPDEESRARASRQLAEWVRVDSGATEQALRAAIDDAPAPARRTSSSAFFEVVVFRSLEEEPRHCPADAVYLHDAASADRLFSVLNRIFGGGSVELSRYDDEIVAPSLLPDFEAHLRGAIASVEQEPEARLVYQGYNTRSFAPNVGIASRQVMFDFLHAVLVQTQLAQARGEFLHWGSGY